MNEKTYNVSYNYTLDFISWDCPECEGHVEKYGDELYDLDCPTCGLERELTTPQDTYDELETLEYSNEDEEE